MQGVKRLLDLQETDIQLQDIAARLADLPPAREAEKLQKVLHELERNLNRDQETLQGLQREIRRAELDVQTGTATLKELEDKLYGGTVKSTKELGQIQARIEQEKTNVARREEEALTTMESVESMQAQVSQAETRLAEVRERLAQAQRESASQERDLLERRNQLQPHRAELVEQLDPIWLQRYDKVYRNRDRAVAVVEDGACQGCHVEVHTSVLSEVKKSQKPVLCENCGRILVQPS